MSTPILIIGTGRKAQATLEILQENNLLVYGFLAEEENRVASEIFDIPILATIFDPTFTSFLKEKALPFFALEDTQQQKDILERYASEIKNPIPNAIHPKAHLARHVHIGNGNLIMAHTTLALNASIGSHVTLEEQVIIGAEAHIGDHVHIGAGTIISPGVTLHPHVTIGPRTVIMPDLDIKPNTTIPAGTIITTSP